MRHNAFSELKASIGRHYFMDQTDNFDRVPHPWSTTQGRNRSSLHHWCDLAVALQSVRGQWKSSLLVALSEELHSIPQFQRRLGMANRRVIVRALRELETDGLITRHSPQSHDYYLTQDGLKLVEILHDLATWQSKRQQKPLDGISDHENRKEIACK